MYTVYLFTITACNTSRNKWKACGLERGNRGIKSKMLASTTRFNPWISTITRGLYDVKYGAKIVKELYNEAKSSKDVTQKHCVTLMACR